MIDVDMKRILFWGIIFYFLLVLSSIIVTLMEIIIEKKPQLRLVVGLGIIRFSPFQSSDDSGALFQDLTFVE